MTARIQFGTSSSPLIMQSQSSAWYWGRNRPSSAVWRHLRDIGFSAIRYTIDASQLITGPRVYDWATRIDDDMALFANLGFQVVMNPQWAPAHFQIDGPEEGNAYGELVRGCAVFDKTEKRGWRYANLCGYTDDNIRHVATHDPIPNSCGHAKYSGRHRDDLGNAATMAWSMDRHPYQPEKPWCVHPNIPHIDPGQEFDFAAALAHRYGKMKLGDGRPLVIGWARGNEYDGMWHWPPMSEGPWEVQYDRAAVEQWGPFLRGVKSILPDACVIGSDAASPGGLHSSIEAMARIGLRWDRIAGHLYAAHVPFPEGTINEIERVDGWRSVKDRHGYDELLNLEYTDASGDGSMPSNGKIVEGTRFLVEEYPWIVAHCHHDESAWFEGGREALAAGTIVRNDLSREMERLIKGDAVPPLPPPAPRVLTEPCYRIVDMERYETTDRTFIASVYLFVALRYRVPKPIVTYGESLAVTIAIWQDWVYMVVPINRSSIATPNDQQFAIHLDNGNGPPYFGPKMWSDLPPVTCAELGIGTDGTKRRAARS